MKLLPIIQIAVSVLLVTLILLQERSVGLSGIFGGEGGGFYQARRGAEKFIYWATIVLTAVFVVLAVLQLKF